MFGRDLLYAARTLRRSPVFTATAILTIALGIGASTAIFSVTGAVLLRPLPYRDPDRLVFVIGDLRARNVKDFPLSNADFLDLRDQTTNVFDEVGAVATFRGTVPKEDGTSEQLRFAQVTTNFFHLMGANVEAGRGFSDADGVPQAAPPPDAAAPAPPARLPAVVMLSHAYWQSRFGGRTDILGKPLPGFAQGNNIVVGVLKPGFELLFASDSNMERLPDVWTAARIFYDNAARNNVTWRAIARLRPGVTIEQAQAAADRYAAAMRAVNGISRTAGFAVRVEPVHRHLVEEVRPALITLMGAVLFLLLIACANVANLLLVRASLRERELAVRTALGGNWWHLVTQMLAEALLLALAGGAAGVALASFAIAELRALAPANLPRLDAVAVDPSTIGFATLAALAAAALFGTIPAWRTARPDIAHVLRGAGRNAGLGRAGWLRSGVVVAEVALCFVLMIGSGLMFRSFLALNRIEPGFDARHLLTFQVLGRRGQQPEQRAAFERGLQTALADIPGVESVAAGLFFPLTGGYSPIRWGTAAAAGDPAKFQAADFQIVLPGYFEAMRTPLLAGRTFTDADNVPGRKVVIVDQTLAAKAFPGENAVGKQILTRINTPQPESVEIVGVVGHVRATSLAEPGREQIYFTDAFIGHGAVTYQALRVAGDPARYGAAARAAVARFDRSQAVTGMASAEEVLARARSSTRFQLLLIGVFAGVALLLAGVGLYGVLATVVRQRTAEIGVRMALGAAPRGIFALIVGHGLRLSAIGIAAGILAALALTRVMTTMLVGIRPADPLTFIAMIALFAAIATLAAWLPARRAASLDPTEALREQ
ncbi:MAG: ABC transporter permease [Acidobacteria bacterium]|nr:ABC transporter permease [Acidobacteriota bacterium]